MLKKWSKILAGILAFVCLGAAAFAVYATYALERAQNVEFPPIAADRSPAGVKRGAVIFHATCEACHRAPNGERASGAPMHDAPEWLGHFHSGNITSDPEVGIGKVSDAVVARMIRFGVNRHGRWAPMPAYALSDADLASVIGFLRSDDPLFRPDPRQAPRSALSLAGKLVLFLAGATKVPERPARGIVAPPCGPSVEYGRYLAESVYQCGDCHTPGFDSDKVHGPDAYAGGGELKNAAGQLILSPNLTKDEGAGLGRWNRDDFARAIRDGIRPDGVILSYPMLRFRGADETEVDALFAYLRSFPAQSAPVPGRVPARKATAPANATPSANAPALANAPVTQPEQSFKALGCVGCHGKGSLYEAKLVQARGKPAADLARWIRNPEAFLPGTVMPTFAGVLDEPSALALAEWIREGGASRL